jgi:hypothetical protein
VNLNLARWLGAIGAALSLVAILDLPYGYYTFNRVALTAIAVLLGMLAVKCGAPGWLLLLVPIAVLWNPAVPIYLDRETWTPLNLLAAAALFLSGFLLGRSNQKITPSSTQRH